MLNKQEITELLQAPPSPKLAEEQASEETAEQTEQPLAETESATASSAKVTRARTWHDLLRLMKDFEDFDMTTDHAMLMAGCLKRQLLMMPRIRALAAATHQHRGILSRAALAGNDGKEGCCSEYHQLVHELALARSASMSDGEPPAGGLCVSGSKCWPRTWMATTPSYTRPLMFVRSWMWNSRK